MSGRARRSRVNSAVACVLCLVAVASAVRASPGTQAEPQLAPAKNVTELVERAGRYVVEYGAAMSLVIGVERYTQHVANADAARLGVPTGERPWTRQTVSEFALVRVQGQWLGFRDVYEVDGTSVEDRRDRLQRLFQLSPAGAFEQAQRIADESARYNAGAVQRNFNVPTLALFFLHPSNAARFRFDRAGTDTLDGTPVWKVRYREVQKPTIIRTTDGKNVVMTGMFWIDPLNGGVLRTFLEVTGVIELAGGSSGMPESLGSGGMTHDQAADRRVETYSRVTTSYRPDSRLGLLLPAEMTEDYQGLSASRQTGRERVSRISCKATYSDFKRFETDGRVIVK